MPKYVFNPFTAKLDVQASTKSDVGLSNVDNVQQIPLSYLDTDGTLSANSDTKVASQKATKTYADQLIGAANALVYKGTIDCSANPNYPAADAGHMYIVSVAGKIGGASGVNVEVGDMIICNTDGTASGNQATVGANFNIIEKNIEGAVSGPASAVTNNVATFDGTTGKIIKDSGLTLSGTNTGDVTVTDSSTIDFTLTGQALSGSVIQSGITHNNLSGLTTGDPHTQYALLAGRSGGQTLIGGTANNNVLTLQGNSGTGNTATNKAISLLVGNSGATEAVTVLNNGDVGIGTTSPGVKLTVLGRGIYSLTSSTKLGDIDSILEINGDYGANAPLYIFDTRAAQLGTGGNLTFGGYTNGTTAPKRFALLGGLKENATAGNQAGMLWFMLNRGAGLDTSTPVMAILGSNGSVGIGTTNPGEKLQIADFSSNASNYLYIASAGGSVYKQGVKLRHFSDNYGFTIEATDVFPEGFNIIRHQNSAVGVSALWINRSNGNVGIGTTTPQGALHVKDGDGYAMYKYVSPINSATPIVIIPNGTGDVTKIVYFQIVATDQTNSSSSSGSRAPGGAVADIVLGTNIFRLTVNVNGSVDVRRQVGTGTISAMIYLQWI